MYINYKEVIGRKFLSVKNSMVGIPILFNASAIYECGIIGETYEKMIRFDWCSSF